MDAISSHVQSAPVISSPKIAPVMVKPAAVQPRLSVAISYDRPVEQSKDRTQANEQQLQKAVQQANITISGSNETIAFGYEEKLGQLFVQITDKGSGEVIREIPSKEFLQHRVYMREMIGILLDKQA